MYLSRLILNARSREVRRDLANCHDLHRTLMRGFPAVEAGSGDAARAHLGVLFRLETDARTGAARVLVQSALAPDWEALPPGYLLGGDGLSNPETKPVGEAFAAIQAGDELLFRLRANPTKRLPPTTGTDGVRRDGKRVELRTEEALVGWLAEKGVGNPTTGRPGAGFRLLTVQARPGLPLGGNGAPPAVADARSRSAGKVTGQALRGRDDGAATRQRLTFGDVVFDGRLMVTDADLFRTTLAKGIGTGKAYGFGLLSVARSRS